LHMKATTLGSNGSLIWIFSILHHQRQQAINLSYNFIICEVQSRDCP
jgi:hypothetical protein